MKRILAIVIIISIASCKSSKAKCEAYSYKTEKTNIEKRSI